VELSVPEVLEASGPIQPASAAEDEAGTAAVAVGVFTIGLLRDTLR
jgi:hypothetical protein